MPKEAVSSHAASGVERVPPHNAEAEKGVLGSILLDSDRVMDLCIVNQIVPESFYLPSHKLIYAAMSELSGNGSAIDVLTVGEKLQASGRLEEVGGSVFLDQLVDSTPTSAHAEYYIDIVRQKHLLRSIIDCARCASNDCYSSNESADLVLGRAEQSFLDITERQHGHMVPWSGAVKEAMEHIEKVFVSHGAEGLSGMPTGFGNLDETMQGLRHGEMIVIAARPSMGKTSLAMGIAANVAMGKTKDGVSRPVGVFSLEMSYESLVMRMLCSYAGVSSFKLMGGYVSKSIHGQLMQAASMLSKAPIYLDDTGGLDVLEMRARARRMKKKHNVELIVIDYLQLLHFQEFARQGRQIETAQISGQLKAMAKELKVPVIVLSQLSRAPEQRDKLGKPKLSDLRDSGAIEQDADVVCMLRRPCKYPVDDDSEDKLLAVVDVVKQRNGPTGEARLNFEEEYTRFRDRAHGVDGGPYVGQEFESGEVEEPVEAEGGVVE